MRQNWFVEEAGQGYPLVLIHGLGASSFSWRGNIGPLSRYFRVLAPDLPAHGRTAPQAVSDFRLETLARGIVDLLEQRGLTKALLAGNSLGGSLSLILAAALPGRFPALALLAPAAALPRPPYIFRPLRLPLLGQGLAALMGPWTARLALRLAYHRRDLITPAVAAGYAPTFRPLANRLALRRLACQAEPWPLPKVEVLLQNIRQPTCLIWGQQDLILPATQAAWLRKRLPQAEVHLLPGVGHAPQEEAPDLVNKIIIAFLSGSIKNE